MIGLKEEFLAYCKYYAHGKERDIPLHDRTVGRYQRGLDLVEKIIGHDLNHIDDADQLRFIQGIADYAQGTRRVSTQIFQRFLAWCIKNNKMDVNNLIVGKENDIIGEDTPVSYTYLSREQVKQFFKKLSTPKYRIVFGLMYYAGLTIEEIAGLTESSIDDAGLLVYREVRKESQVIPLSRSFMSELRTFAEGESGPIVPELTTRTGRSKVPRWYRQAQAQTEELLGTTPRDLRISGIRHFFEQSYDIELTKQYAGVPSGKKGWLDSLVDTSYYYRMKIAKARSHYEKSQEVGR